MTEENVDAGIDPIELTTHIVHAYVSSNPVPAVELPHTIAGVHAAVRGLQSGSATPQLSRTT
ncbi:MucR family transcriptional regulator [Mesorhizobium sp. A556]